MHAILIVDGDDARRARTRRRLASATCRPVLEAVRVADAIAALGDTALVLLSGAPDAASAVTALRATQPGLAVIVIARSATGSDVPAALVAGAMSVVPHDIDDDDLALIADAAIRGRGLVPTPVVRSALAEPRDAAAIESLAFAVEAKDTTTSRHLRAVSRLAGDLAAMVDPELAGNEDFCAGCMLHDVGKIGVPEAILTKPAPLDEDEWIIMRTHPQVGVRVIEPLGLPRLVRDVVLHHHERWDGGGYPDGLAGEEIPLGARVFSVCYALDAMTSHRPYRRALAVEEALERLSAEAGSQFDPGVVDVLSAAVRMGAVRPWQRRSAREAAATLSRS